MSFPVETTKSTWKVSVIGLEKSGKTALISRIVYGNADAAPQFSSIIKKSLELKYNGQKSKADLLIQELDWKPEAEKLLSGSAAVIVTIDLTDSSMLPGTEEIMKYLDTFNKKSARILVGTKLDRKYEAQLWDEEIQPLCKKYSMEFIKVSAKTSEGVQDLLQIMSNSLHARQRK